MPAAHWGYLPGWAKDFKKQRPQPINALIETVSVDVAHVPQVERDRAGEHPGCQLLGAGGDGNGDGQATALHSPAAPRGADKEATSNRKRSVTCPKLPNPRRGKSSVLHQCQHSVRGTACG